MKIGKGTVVAPIVYEDGVSLLIPLSAGWSMDAEGT